MLRRSITFLGLGASILCSCGTAKPVFHDNSDYEFPPSPPDCNLRVVGTHPGPGYEEIGIITIEGDRSYGWGSYQDANEFVEQVRPELCAAGADVVITEVNGAGVVARGIVLVRGSGAGAAVPEAEPEPAPATASECTPICSPGFECSAGTCIPLCNPACAPTDACGMDRLCHPRVEAAPPPPAAN